MYSASTYQTMTGTVPPSPLCPCPLAPYQHPPSSISLSTHHLPGLASSVAILASMQVIQQTKTRVAGAGQGWGWRLRVAGRWGVYGSMLWGLGTLRQTMSCRRYTKMAPDLLSSLSYPGVSFSSRGLPLSSLRPGGLVPGLAGW